MVWTVESEGDIGPLEPWLSRIEEAVYDVEERVEPLLGRFPVEFVVLCAPGRVIPERGHVGGCFRPGRIDLSFDPQNETLSASMGRPLDRMIAHEAHHAARWRGPGYGRTLGEAIVTEGLACRFAEEVYGDPPEPWEVALDADGLMRWTEAARPEFGNAMYDHRAWFFGGSRIPRWAGYSIGFDLVGRFLRQADDGRASAHVDTPAVTILGSSPRMKSMRG